MKTKKKKSRNHDKMGRQFPGKSYPFYKTKNEEIQKGYFRTTRAAVMPNFSVAVICEGSRNDFHSGAIRKEMDFLFKSVTNGSMLQIPSPYPEKHNLIPETP